MNQSYQWALETGPMSSKLSLQDNINALAQRIYHARKKMRTLWRSSSHINEMTKIATEYHECLEEIRKCGIFKVELEYLRDQL